jgi:hypothetical protein
MRILHEETDVLNEKPDYFFIGKRKFTHKLLCGQKYQHFMERFHYYMLILHAYYRKKNKSILEMEENDISLNLNLWSSEMYKKTMRLWAYRVFVLCFFQRKFYYEDIFFKEEPIKFLTIKPLLWILDKIHGVLNRRVSFKYFDNNVNIIEQTNIFLGIAKTQVDGVKKKQKEQLRGYMTMFTAQSQRNYMAKVFSDLEEFGLEMLTDENGILLDPKKIQHQS